MDKAQSRLPMMLLSALLAGISAQAALSAAPDSAVVEARLQEAAMRLKLTPAQQEQLKPIFQERSEKFKAIRDKHYSNTSRGARREMLKEAQPVQQDFENKVSAVLDASQQAEWEKMRQEAHERLAAAKSASDFVKSY